MVGSIGKPQLKDIVFLLEDGITRAEDKVLVDIGQALLNRANGADVDGPLFQRLLFCLSASDYCLLFYKLKMQNAIKSSI